MVARPGSDGVKLWLLCGTESPPDILKRMADEEGKEQEEEEQDGGETGGPSHYMRGHQQNTRVQNLIPQTPCTACLTCFPASPHLI